MQKHNKHLGANEEDALYRPVYITEMAVLKVLDNNLTTCSINSYGPSGERCINNMSTYHNPIRQK